jgi:hypothetical protein
VAAFHSESICCVSETQTQMDGLHFYLAPCSDKTLLSGLIISRTRANLAQSWWRSPFTACNLPETHCGLVASPSLVPPPYPATVTTEARHSLLPHPARLSGWRLFPLLQSCALEPGFAYRQRSG